MLVFKSIWGTFVNGVGFQCALRQSNPMILSGGRCIHRSCISASIRAVNHDGIYTAQEVRDVVKQEGGFMLMSQLPVVLKQFKGKGVKKSMEALSSEGLFSIQCKPDGCTYFLTIEDKKCVAEKALMKRMIPNNKVDYVPKEKVDKLPLVPYKQTKKIAVVADRKSSNEAVAKIRKELSVMKGTHFKFVGYDTETKPVFEKGGFHPPAMIQLATPTTAYLFRLKYEKMNPNNSVMTKSLKKLLADPSVIKVGINTYQDMKELRYYGKDCVGDGKSYLDLRPIARVCWPNLHQRRFGLQSLAAAALGWHLPKSKQLSLKNWEMNELTEAMKQYAASDAFVALDLLDALVDNKASLFQDGTCTAEQVRYIIKKERGSVLVSQFIEKYENVYGKRPFKKGKATKGLKELAKSGHFGIECKADGSTFLLTRALYDGTCTAEQVRDIIEKQGGCMNVSQFVQKYISIYGNMAFKKGKATKGLKKLAKSGLFAVERKANGATVVFHTCTAEQVRDIIEREGGSVLVSQFVQKYESIYGTWPFKKGKATKKLMEVSKSGYFGVGRKTDGCTYFLTSSL